MAMRSQRRTRRRRYGHTTGLRHHIQVIPSTNPRHMRYFRISGETASQSSMRCPANVIARGPKARDDCDCAYARPDICCLDKESSML
ncbi:hypothetical protein PAXRUDRAFT_787255 [Paxillus rubicundulus Ve08.2h10]|uniref:Uncharacterized protein n=1 Tax=Paxillus rubicundulus Ve08.2h10 TaxID=930991 RepID=A0A0D0DW94_9AGAM|nr:hypothetical protein PAXRUDRAFT_787255 [Paxillus rubicundulus Ve08.2h10]